MIEMKIDSITVQAERKEMLNKTLPEKERSIHEILHTLVKENRINIQERIEIQKAIRKEMFFNQKSLTDIVDRKNNEIESLRYQQGENKPHERP